MATAERSRCEPSCERRSPVENPFLSLQATAGNRAVSNWVQAKMAVGPAEDRYEREADEIAAYVVEHLGGDNGDGAAALDEHRAGVAGRIQRASTLGSAGGELDPETEASVQSARRGGAPLGPGVATKIGSAVGADFSGVRVHRGPEATALNDRIQANAFTVGNDIFLREGTPDERTEAGQKLLAHELTHTIQQGAAPIRREAGGPAGKIRRSARLDGRRAVAQRDFLGLKKLWNKLSGKTKKEGGETYDEFTDEPEQGESEQTESFGDKEQLLSTVEQEQMEFFNPPEDDGEQVGDTPPNPVIVACLETVAKAGNGAVEAAAEAYVRAAKAKDFGSEQLGASIQGSGGVEAKTSGKAQVLGSSGSRSKSKEVENGGEPEKETENLLTAIGLLIEAEVLSGARLTLEGEAHAKYGKLVGANVITKLDTFAGVLAKSDAKVTLDLLQGLAVGGSVETQAGVPVALSGEFTLDVWKAYLKAEGNAEGFAGAQAKAEGTFKVGPGGVALSGKAEAFAGLKGSLTAGTEFGLKGLPIAKLTGELTGYLGAGAKAEGAFTLKDGKIAVKAELASVLGYGFGGKGDVEVDLGNLALGLFSVVKEEYMAIMSGEVAPDEVPLVDKFTLRPRLTEELRKLEKKKKIKGTVVSRGEIQDILDRVTKKDKLVTEDPDLVAWLIVDILEEVFGPYTQNEDIDKHVQLRGKDVRSFPPQGLRVA
jgi:hypothetical protein